MLGRNINPDYEKEPARCFNCLTGSVTAVSTPTAAEIVTVFTCKQCGVICELRTPAIMPDPPPIAMRLINSADRWGAILAGGAADSALLKRELHRAFQLPANLIGSPSIEHNSGGVLGWNYWSIWNLERHSPRSVYRQEPPPAKSEAAQFWDDVNEIKRIAAKLDTPEEREKQRKIGELIRDATSGFVKEQINAGRVTVWDEPRPGSYVGRFDLADGYEGQGDTEAPGDATEGAGGAENASTGE